MENRVFPYLAREITEHLSSIEGVKAVVLGGSWARGAAKANSDMDLGIYYEPNHLPSLAALRYLAQKLDDRHAADLVTDFGGWGPWINGGGWLQVQGQHVDWIYRDLALVRELIVACQAGQPQVYYQPGHPHGFHTHIYLAEIHHCVPLYDPQGVVADLKAQTSPYPPRLKQALTEKFLWEAQFSLSCSRKSAQRGETYYVSGFLFRCVACLVQVLFALNEQYFTNEKGSVFLANTFPQCPPHFALTVNSVLRHLGSAPTELQVALDRLEALVQAVSHLCSIAAEIRNP